VGRGGRGRGRGEEGGPKGKWKGRGGGKEGKGGASFSTLDAFGVSIQIAFGVSGSTLAMCPTKTLFSPPLLARLATALMQTVRHAS